MEFTDAVNQRRARRSFAPVEITDALVRQLAGMAALAPSCSNKQPWRFVFVRSPGMLQTVLKTLAPGNATWGAQASLMVVVWSQADLDCRTPDGRDYYQFDTGMATAFLILAATDKGLESHPIAGFDPEAARLALNLPDGAKVITVIIMGGHAAQIAPILSDWQVKAETERPARLEFEAIASIV
jgi:nitroreductase